MTGISKHCHISEVLEILKIFKIVDLNIYMKLVFVNNLKNSKICSDIFNFLINLENQKENPISFGNDLKKICTNLNKECNFVINNIKSIIEEFKISRMSYDESNLNHEIIKCCLENNSQNIMRKQLNDVLYAGNIILNIND